MQVHQLSLAFQRCAKWQCNFVTISTISGGAVYGTVITGLNHFAPGPAPDRTQIMGPSSIWGSPQMRVQFSSCYIQRALKSEAGFKPVENTLMDNWASF